MSGIKNCLTQVKKLSNFFISKNRKANYIIFSRRYIGWGTWIRTRTDGVRVRSSTVKLFPSISASSENSMAFNISSSRYKPKLEKIILRANNLAVGENLPSTTSGMHGRKIRYLFSNASSIDNLAIFKKMKKGVSGYW